MNDYTLEKEANWFRTKHGYNSLEPIPLQSLLLKLDVLTLFKPLSNNFSGMAIKAGEQRFILVNSNHPIGKQNFTICHELYHLYIQKDFHSMQCSTGLFDKKSNKIEYYADLFAANLLMPTQGILMHIPDQENVKNKISLHTLLKIEQTYSCSRSALLFRLINMNLLSLEMAENFRKNVIQKASQLGRSLDLYQPGNSGKMIGLYGSMARQLFEEQKISEGHYYELMNEAGLRIEGETDEIWQH